MNLCVKIEEISDISWIIGRKRNYIGKKRMDVSYNKLFKLLIDKGMKKTVFAKTVGISANTLAKLSHNEMVSMEIIVRICRTFHCTVDDIMDILPETTER